MINSQWSSMKIEALTDGFTKTFDGDTKWRTAPGWELAFEKIDKKPLTSQPNPEIKLLNWISINIS